MAFETSKEMLINIKDAPKYDKTKSFYEQSNDVYQFYAEERKKIIEGVNIGGYYVHPWLYYHLNIFKTPVPMDGQEIIMNPPLNDNILFVTENYHDAQINNLGLCLFGTRGFNKSTLLSSLISWINTTKINGVTNVVGGDAGDLRTITRLIKTSMMNVHEAFFLPTITSEWDSHVEFGWKKRNNQDAYIHSELIVRNAEEGREKKSEKSAGLSPVGYIMDEIGKFDPRGILKAALPGFVTPNGSKLVHVLSGTGGNATLSEGAKYILENPAEFKILPMNFDRLERGVPEEAITWKDDRSKVFGTFVPAQMSYRLDVPKVKKSFAEHIDIQDPILEKIPIYVTDWVAASKKLRENLDMLKNEEARNKERMYYPTEIDHCFLTEATNPFPKDIIIRRINELKSKEISPKRVEILNDGKGFYEISFSEKALAPQQYDGKEVDAPILIHRAFPTTPPPKNKNVAGLDAYKTNQAKTGSLGAIYILQRRNTEMNLPCEVIVASLTARPKTQKMFNMNIEKMLNSFNAMCNMEAVDTSFQTYLESRGQSGKSLVPKFLMPSLNGSQTHPYGTYPTPQNNSARFNMVLEYAWEEHTIDIDENGTPIVKYGVEYIDDIQLLQEMLDYPKGSLDRFDAFGYALMYAKELDKKNVVVESKTETVQAREKRRVQNTGPFIGMNKTKHSGPFNLK